MRKFKWPEHIKFDDTEFDIKAARKAWLGFFGISESGGANGEFLAFVQAYSEQVDKRWQQEQEESDRIGQAAG